MLKNYLKVALRSIRRHKAYSLINLAGLAVGLAACILILFWVQDELSFDRFHEQAENIFRALEHESLTGGTVLTYPLFPPPFGPALKQEYPEVREMVRIWAPRGRIVQVGDSSFYEDRLMFADPALLSVFSFPLIKGDAKTALQNPDSILITEDTAAKYFPGSDPMGQILHVDAQHDFQVRGVLRNPPANSHIRFDFVVPFSNLEKYDWDMNSWGGFGIQTYVQLEEGTDLPAFNEKIKGFIQKYDEGNIMTLSLQPLKKIHLYSAGISASNSTGDIKSVVLFTVIAFLILLMACVNFMNLTTARSENRAREVGLRKVVGAGRRNLVFQFFGESVLLALIALFLALNLVHLILPSFNLLSGKQLSFAAILTGPLAFGVLGIALLAGLVAGSYPALYLSSIQPIRAFRRKSISRDRSALFRKILVVSQFVLTICLVLGTIVIHQQIQYIRNRDLGIEKSHIICLNLKGDLPNRYQVMKDRILEIPTVQGVTAASDPPAGNRWSMSLNDWEGRDTESHYLMDLISADSDYLDVFGLELTAGRFLSPESGDEIHNIVVNETAVKAMGMTDPLGKRVRNMRIIGVVKDFHYDSLHHAINPLGMFHAPDDFDNLLVRILSANISSTLDDLQRAWAVLAPEYPFEFRFLDDSIDELYTSDKNMGRLINIATGLALFIASLGLFGMASFTVEQRTREVGIRKVLGASISSLFLLLSKESLKWIAAANLIAGPLAFLGMQKWLSNYAFRVSINPLVFVLSAAATFITAILTIGYQTLKAALSSPVRSLHNE